MEGNFEALAMADADAPILAPATNPETCILVAQQTDELIGELSCEIPTVAQAQKITRLLRNAADLILCMKKLEPALFAPG